MSNQHKREYNKKLNPPKNIDLPFFAYGIFKPGQLAYSKIKEYVHGYVDAEVNYPMESRDGVPILINQETIPNNPRKNHLFL